MTSGERSLLTAGGNDRGSLLCTLELVVCGGVQLAEGGWEIVGQGMVFEPGPQLLYWLDVGGVRGQGSNLNVPAQTVQILPNQSAAMRLQAVPDHQQWLPQMLLERLEEFDDHVFLDTALEQSEQAVGAGHPGDHRLVVPVEMEQQDGGLLNRRAGPHPIGGLADARSVYKDNQAAFSLGFFLGVGHVHRFQCRTPCIRSMTATTHLRVRKSVPRPCSGGLCMTDARARANCDASSWAGARRAGRQSRLHRATSSTCTRFTAPRPSQSQLRLASFPPAAFAWLAVASLQLRSTSFAP